jgi:hypothetical protein
VGRESLDVGLPPSFFEDAKHGLVGHSPELEVTALVDRAKEGTSFIASYHKSVLDGSLGPAAFVAAEVNQPVFAALATPYCKGGGLLVKVDQIKGYHL